MTGSGMEAAVEASARVICDGMAAVDGPPWNWENTSDWRRQHFCDVAREAITAAKPHLEAELADTVARLEKENERLRAVVRRFNKGWQTGRNGFGFLSWRRYNVWEEMTDGEAKAYLAALDTEP